jgi:hypothetical protein
MRASTRLEDDPKQGYAVSWPAAVQPMYEERKSLTSIDAGDSIRRNAVAICQLIEDFGRYLYLPRIQSPAILIGAIQSGLALLTWESDAFAYAESFDESKLPWRSPKSGHRLSLQNRP